MIRIVFILFIGLNCLGQELTLKETVPITADTFIGIDGYECIYTLTDNIIYKTGATGAFEFSDIQLGDVTSVDIINPLKVIVYYNEFNTVIFLDNRLIEIERFSFNELPNFINTGVATNAGNNRLWILNTDTQQIELYNYSTQKTVEISQPITDEIIAVASNFNFFYVLTKNEVRQFNIYGGVLHNFKVSEGIHLIQDTGNLLVTTPSQLLYKTKKGENFTPLIYPEILKVNLQLRRDLLYIYNGENIATFSLNLPKK